MRVWSLVDSPGVQALGLVIVTLVAYYYAFFDVARADQWTYLYRTSDSHGFWNLTVHAYDFNRTNSSGDFVLFRPVQYLILGLERWLWGYDFTLWQATSIGLHIMVVLSLFTYCRRGCRRFLTEGETSFAPFVIALFFALLYAGTEMVAWHHIVGYLLFCLLAAQGALAYQRLIENRETICAASLVTTVGLACFTYELGNVMACVMAVGLLASIFAEHGRSMEQAEYESRHRLLFTVAFALIFLPVLYAVWSYADYVATVGGVPHSSGFFSLGKLLAGVGKLASLWLTASLVPAVFHLSPGPRIMAFQPFAITGTSTLIGANLAILVIILSARLIWCRSVDLDPIRDWVPGATALILAASYTAIIMAGRGLPLGLSWTFVMNSYYAYIFMLYSVIAFFHLVIVPSMKATEERTVVVRRLLFAALSAIAIFGGTRIYFTHRTMYRTYSGPMRELIGHIEALKAQHGRESDFSFSLAPDCSTIFEIPWFGREALEKRKRYTVATALFPHSERSQAGKYIIECPKP